MKVIKQLPIGSLGQRVDQSHHFRIIVPFIPKALAYMRPVFLLHMRVVILLVRPTARHEHRSCSLLEPPQHVIVQKLSPVVTVQAQQLKRQAGFHIAQRHQCPRLAAPPHRPQFHPRRRVVHSVDHPHKFSSHASAAQCDRIHFQPTGFAFLPHAAANRNLMAQQRSGPR